MGGKGGSDDEKENKQNGLVTTKEERDTGGLRATGGGSGDAEYRMRSNWEAKDQHTSKGVKLQDVTAPTAYLSSAAFAIIWLFCI